jgi:hypothetical protein
MVIHPWDVNPDSDKAKLAVADAARQLGIECKLWLASMWQVACRDCDREAFLALAREQARKYG